MVTFERALPPKSCSCGTCIARLIELEADSGTEASQVEVDVLQSSCGDVQLMPTSVAAVQQSISDVQGTEGTIPIGKFPHIEVSKVYVSVGRSKVILLMSELMRPQPARAKARDTTDVETLSDRDFIPFTLTPPPAGRRRSRDRACAPPRRRRWPPARGFRPGPWRCGRGRARRRWPPPAAPPGAVAAPRARRRAARAAAPARGPARRRPGPGRRRS